MRHLLSVALAAFVPVAAQGETIRLTPERAEAAKEAGAARRIEAGSSLLPSSPATDRRVHGEVGVTIGTGGYRSFYGVAAVPLGDDGELALGYNDTRARSYGYGPGYYDACGFSVNCVLPFSGPLSAPRR